MASNELPLIRQLGYASGMLGWSILINIIAVMLIYYYLPPNNSGMPPLIPQVAVFGIFTLLSLIAASGRLLDAVTDPLIAFLSDRSHHPGGRRLPFMRWAVAPAVFFCVLIFLPLTEEVSRANVWWLTAVQAGFYLSLTVYIIPYNALLPELAPDDEAKVRLSTWLSFTFVLGIIISSQTPLLADIFQSVFPEMKRQPAFQWAITSLCLLAGVFLIIPVFAIDESRDCRGVPTTLPLGASILQILRNRNFLVFILADFAYFVSLTIISSGMLYFVKVLLSLPESIGGQVMGLLVIVSLLFYPTVVRLSQRWGKRPLMIGALLYQGLMLVAIFFFGRLPFSPETQIYGFAVLAAVPAAFLGILPYAIIAGIAERDGERSGQQKEAMFFAVRNFTVKLGQTAGIIIFATFTLFGKDPADDLGIRLSALAGAALCLLAGILFFRFREEREGS